MHIGAVKINLNPYEATQTNGIKNPYYSEERSSIQLSHVFKCVMLGRLYRPAYTPKNKHEYISIDVKGKAIPVTGCEGP
jgi:hypothetical protein